MAGSDVLSPVRRASRKHTLLCGNATIGLSRSMREHGVDGQLLAPLDYRVPIAEMQKNWATRWTGLSRIAPEAAVARAREVVAEITSTYD